MSSLTCKRLDCMRDLIKASYNNRFSILKKLKIDSQDVFGIWDSVSQLIEYHMENQKAVQIPGFGLFSFISNKLDIGHNKYILIQQPVFILSEKLAKTHRLTQPKYHVPGEIPIIQLNFMALSHELNIDRDLVESSVKEVVNAFSRSIEQNSSADFAFTTLGTLEVRNGVAKMKFLSNFLEKMDQNGDLAKYLGKRPETSGSMKSDKSILLPKIMPGELVGVSRPPKFLTIEENESKEVNESLPMKKLKEIITPSLKVEPTTITWQPTDGSITIPSLPCSTPNKVIPNKKGIGLKDPRSEYETPRKFSPLPQPACGRVNLVNELLKKKHSCITAPENNCCANCEENMSDFCYLCYQREDRNQAVYFDKERKKEEEEDDQLLQLYNHLKDSQLLKLEQEEKVKKRTDAQAVAAFNLGVSEALKAKKEKKPVEFHRSYLFGRRPITPPHFVKFDDYEEELGKQVKRKAREVENAKKEKETSEKIEQMQMANDFAAQGKTYMDSKRAKRDQYKNALDTQIYIKKCLEERYLERHERMFSLPPPNVVSPFQKLSMQNGDKMIRNRDNQDSNGPLFGLHDLNSEKKLLRRAKARSLCQNQLKMAAEKRKQAVDLKTAAKKEEERMLKNTKASLLADTLLRNELNLSQRQELERDWARHTNCKRSQKLDMLLHEQCDKYKRCCQCTRRTGNCGQSNVWTESRYVSGSRLMV